MKFITALSKEMNNDNKVAMNKAKTEGTAGKVKALRSCCK